MTNMEEKFDINYTPRTNSKYEYKEDLHFKQRFQAELQKGPLVI